MQVGIFGNWQEMIGINPTFSGMTLLNTARNLKTWWNFEDFISPFTSSAETSAEINGPWTSYFSGAGAALAGVAGTAARPGILGFSTGTTAAGLASILGGYTFATASYLFGAGEYTIEGDIYIPNLSTAIEEYDLIFGFADAASIAVVDGAYFLYNRAVAGANWQACTANNSAQTLTDTGIAVTENAWIRLKIVVNADATAVRFYIDDVLVATNVLNIPSGAGRITGPNIFIKKTVGLTARTFNLDWVWLHFNLAVSR